MDSCKLADRAIGRSTARLTAYDRGRLVPGALETAAASVADPSNGIRLSTKEPDVDYTRLSDVELLRRIVGPRVAERIYKGALAPLFSPEPKPGGREKLLAARELIRRMLAEEMRRDNVLTSPTAVRDYLRLLFRGREYESFAVIYLDSQNRVIASEELFRGTLSQTSVYPREVVKRALAQNCAAVIFSHCHPLC